MAEHGQTQHESLGQGACGRLPRLGGTFGRMRLSAKTADRSSHLLVVHWIAFHRFSYHHRICGVIQGVLGMEMSAKDPSSVFTPSVAGVHGIRRRGLDAEDEIRRQSVSFVQKAQIPRLPSDLPVDFPRDVGLGLSGALGELPIAHAMRRKPFLQIQSSDAFRIVQSD